MSKKYIYHIIICCMLVVVTMPLSVFSQDVNSLIRIEYHLKYLKDTTDNFYIEEPAELFISETQSYFNTTQKSTMDSITFLNLDSDHYIQGKSSSLRVLKDFDSNKIKYYEAFFHTELVFVEEQMGVFDWKIESDTASMFGYLCQKAKLSYGGRDWIAWFAAEIPIPDGPYKFCGLPGLIVRMHDTKARWFIDLVSIKHLKGQKLNLYYLDNAEKTDAISLRARVKDLQENYMERLEAAGRISMPTESRAKLIRQSRESLKKYNNPIELYSQ